MEAEAVREKNLITAAAYASLDQAKRLAYLIDTLELKDNYMIGTVLPPNKPDFFLIGDLINPYSGLRNPMVLSDAAAAARVVYRGSLDELGISAGEQVIFQFSAGMEDHDSIVQRGLVIRPIKNSIIPVADEADALRELGITYEQLMLKGILHGRQVFLFSELYQKAIRGAVGEAKSEIESSRSQLQTERDELEQVRRNASAQTAELKKTAVEMSELSNRLQELGFYTQLELIESEEVSRPAALERPDTDKEWVEEVRKQLALRGLFYDAELLRQFVCALKANQLIILSGPSGTGKTSLVSAFTDTIGACKRIIPVQPSWTDKQDLLGFYNPLRKQYVPTAFLDACMEAASDPDTLYLICLDELNLAQIEFYLADLLSVRELEEPWLELYSKYEYEQSMEEIRWYVGKLLSQSAQTNLEEWAKDALQLTTIEQFSFRQRYRNLTRYPWRFRIPENIRFIGTMNVDGTVRPVSPKVVDRSFILEVGKQPESVSTKGAEKGVLLTPSTFFRTGASVPSADKVKKELRSRLGEWLPAMNAQFNNRVEKHIELYAAAASSFGLTGKQLADEIVGTKILPRIHHLLDKQTTVERFITEIREWLGEQSISYRKAARMRERSQTTRIFSYWS